MHLQASALLKRNIEALLRARGQTRHDLAMWCRRSDAWLSTIMDVNGTRGLPLKYLDRIADFFGIETYQLFQPGISPLHERRKGDRRSGTDRRLASAHRLLHDPSEDTQELIRMVLSTAGDERRNLYALLASRRAGAPNTTPAASARDRGVQTTPATRRLRR